MVTERGIEASARGVESRSQEIFQQRLARLDMHTDHGLSWVLLGEWVVVIVLARFRHEVATPMSLSWVGGAVLSVVPIAALLSRRQGRIARYAAATAQILWAVLLSHCGFDRFALTLHGALSLGMIGLYRDFRLLGSAWAAACTVQIGLALGAGAWYAALTSTLWMTAAGALAAVGALRGEQELKRWARCEAILDQTVEAAERQIADRTRDLRASAERFRRLIENISAVPWELERSTGKVVYLAPQFNVVFGLPPSTGGRPQFVELFHRDDREPFKAFLGQSGALRTYAGQFIDSRIMRPDNGVVHVRSFVTDQNSSDAAATVFGVTLDVTQQKRLEFELLQAQKLESIGQLSAGIAHEINTPTRFVGDNIRTIEHELKMLLACQALEPERVRVIERAIGQALVGIDRIADIIQAMQEFSHPALEKMPHDLNRAISSTIMVASNEWKYVAEVTTDFDRDLPLVPVMPGAFNQVILNVLINAAHAVAVTLRDDPGAKGRIALTTRRIADWAEIRVSDTGCGIPEKIRERIFDPFFTTKPIGKGTGQGLAIAHDVIVKKHRGAIWAEPISPTGTTFIIRLPLDARTRETVAA